MGHTLVQFKISGGMAVGDAAVKLLNGNQRKQVLEALKYDRVPLLLERVHDGKNSVVEKKPPDFFPFPQAPLCSL